MTLQAASNNLNEGYSRDCNHNYSYSHNDNHSSNIAKNHPVEGAIFLKSSNHEHYVTKNQTPHLPVSDHDDKEQQQQEPIFSSQASIMDYVTLEGIENRTGVEKENVYAFVLKELLDNAVDFLETQHSGGRKEQMNIAAAAKVHATILKQDNKFLRIMVLNSNVYGKPVFSKDILRSILNFNSFYSSKRNQFKISKGVLGDAFKEVLCIPYALAREQRQQRQQQQQNHTEWNEPLIITTRVNHIQRFFVNLKINRINQTIHSQITESIGENDEIRTSTHQQQMPNYTEIEVRLPIVQGLFDFAKLKRFLTEYTTFNMHIDFTFEFIINPSAKPSEQSNITLTFPQVQQINSKWTNIGSIYYSTLPEFQNFIFGLENNDQPIYSVIQKSFREGSNMKKEGDFARMTVGHLKHSPNQINVLRAQLRNIMRPITSPSNLSLPFDANRNVRMEALKKRVEQRDPSFKISDMKYKSNYGYYKSNNIEFPFFFEIAVIHSSKIPYNLEFIDSLNSSVMPGRYSFLVGSDPQTFQYQTQADRKNNNVHTARTIFEIFEHFGYSYKKEKCKKPQSLIIANLISPRIEYKSYGKSSIDITPFAEVIAETTAKVCSASSTTSRLSNSEAAEENSVIGFLRALLRERYDALKRDPTLKDTQKWTQSTVFYVLRRVLLDHGFSAEKIDRQYITSEIKEVCEKYLGVKREELGISAADRAQLYFKGEWHDVGLEEIGKLITYGTDMVIIEKEGVVKQLAPFADENGIALLNTRGFLTEYASILSEESGKNGCNIAILTDLDASGLLIANMVPDVFRIGIDFETLDYFRLDPKIVEENYKPKSNHLKPLETLATRNSNDDALFDLLPNNILSIFDQLFADSDNHLDEKVKYVSSKRIEIDSVMAAVNDNPRFWRFILSKLQERYPTRNYNRAINVPEYVIPTMIESLIQNVQKKAVAISGQERHKIMEKYSNTTGFLNVNQHDIAVAKKLRTIVEDDKDIKSFLKKLDKLIKCTLSF